MSPSGFLTIVPLMGEHALIKVPTGHPVPSAHRPNWQPEYETPEEGSYEWHLQRMHNADAMHFVVKGTSALEVRERFFQPHHVTHPIYQSWKEFCWVEFEVGANQMNRLILAAVRAMELQNAGCDPPPNKASQVRAVSLFGEPEPVRRIKAWRLACSYKAPGRLPSRSDVLRAVRMIQPIRPPSHDRKIFREMRDLLFAARKKIRNTQAVYQSPEGDDYLTTRAPLKERKLLAKLVLDLSERLASMQVGDKGALMSFGRPISPIRPTKPEGPKATDTVHPQVVLIPRFKAEPFDSIWPTPTETSQIHELILAELREQLDAGRMPESWCYEIQS
jgi:hypothetical protein